MQILQIFLIFLPLFVSNCFGTGNFPAQQPTPPFQVLTQQSRQAQPRNLGLNALSDDQLWAMVRVCKNMLVITNWGGGGRVEGQEQKRIDQK